MPNLDIYSKVEGDSIYPVYQIEFAASPPTLRHSVISTLERALQKILLPRKRILLSFQSASSSSSSSSSFPRLASASPLSATLPHINFYNVIITPPLPPIPPNSHCIIHHPNPLHPPNLRYEPLKTSLHVPMLFLNEYQQHDDYYLVDMFG